MFGSILTGHPIEHDQPTSIMSPAGFTTTGPEEQKFLRRFFQKAASSFISAARSCMAERTGHASPSQPEIFMAPIKLGILGAGIMGERLLRAALEQATDSVTISGIWDP